MFQTILSSLLIALIIIPVPLLLIVNKRQKRKALKALLHEFSIIGSRNDLSFSSQEVLRDTVIGLDGIQRKLLVVQRKGDEIWQSQIIDLSKIKSCLVDKKYRTVTREDSKKPEQLLEIISLVFNLPQLITPDIVFYNYIDDHVNDASELENKANHWQAILSKLRIPPLKTSDVKITYC